MREPTFTNAICKAESKQISKDFVYCEDTISRQAAIDALKNRWKKTRNYEGIGDDIAEECELYLKQVPSAQPEEVTPHRNYQYLSDYWCECGWHLGKMGDVNYCPNCGKKVKWDE